MKLYVTTHIFVRKEYLGGHLTRLRSLFTARSVFDPNTKIPMYKETGKLFGFPLYVDNTQLPTSVKYAEIVDRRSRGRSIMFSMLTPPRVEQVELLKRIHASIDSGKTGIIVDARTGYGKTYLCISALSYIGATAIVVVQKQDLLEQWRQKLVEHSSLSESEVGVVHRDNTEWYGKKVVVAMLQTLLARTYSKEFYSYFGVFCVDEVHTIGAPKFSRVCSMFPTYYKLGASATLKRRDGTAKVFLSALGQIVIRSDIRHEASLQVKVRVVEYRETGSGLKLPRWARTVIQRRSLLLTHLGNDRKRNEIIAYYAHKLSGKQRQVVILSERKDPLFAIAKIAIKKYSVSSDLIGVYTGSTSDAEKERVLRECRVILATTKMLSLGTDVPSLSSLIFASPLASIEQPVGRLLRSRIGKSSVIVVDIVDTKYATTQKWYWNREKEYKTLKAEIKIKES